MPAQRDPYESPAIRAFANELVAWRGSMSKVELAETLGYTPQLLSQFEAGKNIPSEKFAEDLDTYFQTNGLFHRLWKLIRDTRHLLRLPPGFSDFLEREAESSTLYAFEFSVIGGLFQTREYAYEVLKIGRSPEEVEPLVDKRMDRKEILARPKPPRIVAVFDDAAVRRMIGGPDVMRGQISHLIELAKRPNITLQIVPGSTGCYAGLCGAFTILSFESGPDLVYIEGQAGGQLISETACVQEHTVRFDLIRGAAMSADESLKLLHDILEGL
jgi:transcriptional regulator with XRE-family HTH domain